ncbi:MULTISPECIES: DUF1824 family protein [Leptolyngbya]|uniref:DUF1824 family protein n=1 Tax=Leptolyngbya TaxID=47251 RepID=UPI001683B99A|nr:DUF1824 family protein [Leptolyngbya sp. FACHB-1624]MBD1858519.1 DUF1824 family protein [Leptolyngbya sp. FACHB-1624]
MTRSEAETILRQFICNDPKTVTTDYSVLREAVSQVVELSDYQIFGVCAGTAEEGLQALSEYMAAIGYDMPEIQEIVGEVYIKFNPNLRRSHIEPYVGKHRGVLISCQSAYDDGVNETFGHLPLDLFA